jgi:hypothetical protein
MSIELPSEVVFVLNMLGLPWPAVDEDEMRACATHLRDYATSLSGTHDTAYAVVAAKGAIIGALVAMAAELAADQAAAVVTLGIAEAAIPALIGATRLIVKGMLDQLEQQLLAEVLQAALTPLEDKIASALQNMVLQGVEAALA